MEDVTVGFPFPGGLSLPDNDVFAGVENRAVWFTRLKATDLICPVTSLFYLTSLDAKKVSA
jgi:hypothetical protein